MRAFLFTALALASAASAEPPEDFMSCLARINEAAESQGISARVRADLVPELRWRDEVIELDRRQPEFVSSFGHYFASAVNARRIERGRALYAEHAQLLAELTARYGIPGRYLVAFWGLETNYGGYMGKTPSLDALATLACDARRGPYFQAELLAALKLIDEGQLTAEKMVGSWAGALGQVQFMPSNYRRYGRDGDGDGRVDLFSSVRDALTSAAHFLNQLGWEAEQRWGREVSLPTGFDFTLADGKTERSLRDWARLGLRDAYGRALPIANFGARLVVPAGHQGPAFLVYQNFSIIKRWNNSTFYALAVGHLADRIKGAPGLQRSAPHDQPRMRIESVKAVQEKLNQLGFNLGEPDGIPGPATQAAMRAYQAAHGMIADGYLSPELMQKLGLHAADHSDHSHH